VNGSRTCRGMVRDMAYRDDRRMTNLTTGFEFFSDSTTEFDSFVVTKFPVNMDEHYGEIRAIEDRLYGFVVSSVRHLLAKDILSSVICAQINRAIIINKEDN
jgi:hypothetical protein